MTEVCMIYNGMRECKNLQYLLALNYKVLMQGHLKRKYFKVKQYNENKITL